LILFSDWSAGSFCRFRGRYYAEGDYLVQTCSKCLQWMPADLFRKVTMGNRSMSAQYKLLMFEESRIDMSHPHSLQVYSNQQTQLDRSNFLKEFSTFFNDPEDVTLLMECCEAAGDCCNKIRTDKDQQEEDPCPPTWDGWQCWSSGGQAGITATKTCPEYIYFFTHGRHKGVGCDNVAEKSCLSSGWFVQNNTNTEWTDYSPCDKTGDTISMEYLRLSLYGLSASALLPAIFIFHIYRSLQVTRISIHKHLFVSLLLFTITTGLFRIQVLLPHLTFRSSGASAMNLNSIWCRLLIVLTKYFRLTNYAWMWSEGYYLHRLLSDTFEEQHRLCFLLCLGWGAPLLPTLLYSFIRFYYQDTMCWAQPSEQVWVEWITYLPGLLCIAGNIFFFLNIFWILLTKLQAPHANEPTNFRKAVHACSVLVPLFGLQWLLTFYRINTGSCYLLAAYKYTDVLLDSLQGFVVAITFCYRNGEIITLLKRSHSAWRSQRAIQQSIHRRCRPNKDEDVHCGVSLL